VIAEERKLGDDMFLSSPHIHVQKEKGEGETSQALKHRSPYMNKGKGTTWYQLP
jgi:hypothetical protein